MRAGLYARVSTDKQTEKYGLPSQIQALKERCIQKNWDVVPDNESDAFIDDGYSGAELDRPALNRLRRAVKEGKIDLVLAYDPDRLSRKLYHQMILAEELEKQGVKLEFVTQDMGTSPEDRMFFNMRGLIAEFEREKVRERTLRGSREKARQGKGLCSGMAPYGLRFNKEKASLEEEPETSQTVRLIFYSFANENLSLKKLADKLNRLRIQTPRGGHVWRASTLGTMLRNPVYSGKLYQFRTCKIEPKLRRKPVTKTKTSSMRIRAKEDWILVTVPALISPELFDSVQRKLQANANLSKRNTKREYLLSGLLYCAECGGRMGGHAAHGRPYYRCYRRAGDEKSLTSAYDMSKTCACPEIKAEVIEPVVWDTVCQLIKNPDFLIEELQRRAGKSETRDILERELRLCEARLKAIPQEQKRLVEGYRKGLYADFMMREDMELVRKEQGELENRKAELERQLGQRFLAQNQEANIRSLMEKIHFGLEKLDFVGRQDVLRLLVEKLVYNGQAVEIQTIIPPIEQLHPLHQGG